MAIKIPEIGDTITIGRTFVTGATQIRVNGEVAFQGRLHSKSPQEFHAGNRTYIIETRDVGANSVAIVLKVLEGGRLIHDAMYDQAGQRITNEKQAQAVGEISLCTGAGAFGSIALGMQLPKLAAGGVLAGGLGGALIGGMCAAAGALVGFLVGLLLTAAKRNRDSTCGTFSLA